MADAALVESEKPSWPGITPPCPPAGCRRCPPSTAPSIGLCPHPIPLFIQPPVANISIPNGTSPQACHCSFSEDAVVRDLPLGQRITATSIHRPRNGDRCSWNIDIPSPTTDKTPAVYHSLVYVSHALLIWPLPYYSHFTTSMMLIRNC